MPVHICICMYPLTLFPSEIEWLKVLTDLTLNDLELTPQGQV